MSASEVRFHDYFDLQLRFATLMAQRTGRTVREGVNLYTNLRRRFGLIEADDPSWLEFLDRIEAACSAEERLTWALERHAQAPALFRPAHQVPFGCFACEPPNAAGEARIHFMNVDVGAEPGPLSAARRSERMTELGAMFAFMRREFPTARRVIGGSWLYNLDAYRRLFPPEYGESRRPAAESVRLSGTSTWGQMIDHRGLVRPDARSWFTAALETLDIERPWLVFPLRSMTTAAPIAAFFDHYGV